MNIKQGYKQTEIGIIPEDWEVNKFNEMCWFQEGPGLRNWQFTKSGIKVINVTNLESGILNLERTDRHISLNEFHKMYEHFEIQENDIVVASSGNSYGKVAVVRNQDLPLLMNTSVIRFKPLKNLDYGYLLTFLNSNHFKNQIDLMITGGAQPNFGPVHLNKLFIAIPPKQEQTAIATALSDIDALIGELDKLIAKKQGIKQATMQQLLTGKKRLAGFSGEWEVKRLGELVDLYQPITISAKHFTESGYPVYGANGVVGFYHDFNHESSQVTVTCRGSTCGTVNKTIEKSWITGNAMVINCDNSKNIEKQFLYYLLLNKDLSICITGTGQPQIVRSPLFNFILSIPPAIEEQTAIANILSDMDAEISQLEGRRAKMGELKQGMMQELLTGRIRLNTQDSTRC